MKTKPPASSSQSQHPARPDRTEAATQNTNKYLPAERARPLSAGGGTVSFGANDLLSTSGWDVSQNLSAGLLAQKLHMPLTPMSKESCYTVQRRSTKEEEGLLPFLAALLSQHLPSMLMMKHLFSLMKQLQKAAEPQEQSRASAQTRATWRGRSQPRTGDRRQACGER